MVFCFTKYAVIMKVFAALPYVTWLHYIYWGPCTLSEVILAWDVGAEYKFFL